MVSADELKDDDEFADLAEDVEEECKRFGVISRLEIPRPKVRSCSAIVTCVGHSLTLLILCSHCQEGEDVSGLGNIFVRFKDQSEAAAAIKVRTTGAN